MPVPAYLPKPVEILIYNWQQRLQTKGSLGPSPSIAQGQKVGYDTLRVKCTECGHRGEAPLQEIRRRSSTLIADLLPALICTRCGQEGPPVVQIRGVAPAIAILIFHPPDKCDHEEPVEELTLELNSEELDQEP